MHLASRVRQSVGTRAGTYGRIDDEQSMTEPSVILAATGRRQAIRFGRRVAGGLA